MKHPSAVIQVFCKAPILGEVKTRLGPDLNDSEILALYERMLQEAIPRLTAHDLCSAQLWLAGDADHPFFESFSLPRFPQSSGDLGQRMQNALKSGLAAHDKVVLVGCDVPAINDSYLDQALEQLDEHDVVLGPAEDGGYGLVGVRSSVPEIFQSITWGTDQVLSQTCYQLNRIRLNYALLPTVWDVDSPEDLERYSAFLRSNDSKFA